MEQLRAPHVGLKVWTPMRKLTIALCLCATVVSAQSRPLQDADLPWASDDDHDDPIGVQRQDAELDHAPTSPHAADAQAFGPKPPALSTRVGDVLSAPAMVRETSHRVQIEWRAGLALVTTELHFTTTTTRAAEVNYRLSVPEDATLASLQVCAPIGCRDGVVDTTNHFLSAYDDAVQARGTSGLPIAHARALADARGHAISLRAAPVRADQELTVRVAFLVAAPVRGGSVRFSLPARGIDERAAVAEVTLDAPGLTSINLSGAPITTAPALLEAWQSLHVVAHFAPSTAIVTDWLPYRCGDRDCARLWLGARGSAAHVDNVALLLDASPSMRGPARGRMSSAVAALLSLLPQERPIDVAVFGSGARLLARALSPSELALTPLVDAIHAEDLGSGTQFSAAWTALQAWVDAPSTWPRRKHVVLIGDGTIGRNQAAAFEQAARAHVMVSSVNLSDHATTMELAKWIAETGGITLDVGSQAAQATTQDPGALEEALSTMFATPAGALLTLHNRHRDHEERIKLGTILAGGEVTWMGLAGYRARVLGKTQPTDTARNLTRIALIGESRPPTAQSERFGRALSLSVEGAALVAVDPLDLNQVGQQRPKPALQCDPRGPAQRHSGISSDLDPVSLAQARPCRPPTSVSSPLDAATAAASNTAPGAGMPASPLLTMLRQRIMPVARACFRRDRGGRAEYELRAVFELELANQEVADAHVEGEVPETLRACLIDATERLEVPLFTGTVRARYPLRTQSEPLPEEIELTKGVADDLDRLLDGDRGALHTPPAF